MSPEVIVTYLQRIADLERELARMPGVVTPASSDTRLTLDTVVRDPGLKKVVAKLFNDGHHSRAVEEAFKYLNNLVKKTSGCSSLDGFELMMRAFAHKNPILKLNGLGNQSEKDEQLGYMHIFAGVMTGIRNPRAHEHDWEDTEIRALELLSIANHLLERVREATNPDEIESALYPSHTGRPAGSHEPP